MNFNAFRTILIIMASAFCLWFILLVLFTDKAKVWEPQNLIPIPENKGKYWIELEVDGKLIYQAYNLTREEYYSFWLVDENPDAKLIITDAEQYQVNFETQFPAQNQFFINDFTDLMSEGVTAPLPPGTYEWDGDRYKRVIICPEEHGIRY